MKNFRAVSLFLGLAALPAFLLGQNADPFVDHSESGQTIHVLPTPASIRAAHDAQPTIAPPSNGATVYPASYGSGNLQYHGGIEIGGANYWSIYWNSSVANSSSASLYPTVQQQVNAFVKAFADNSNWDNSATDDFTIVQQYGAPTVIGNSFPLSGTLVDTQPTKSGIRDSAIQQYLAGLFNAGKLPASPNAIYGVYFPAGMRIMLSGGSSCSSFCGYHSVFSYGSTGMQIKYAVFPYPNCMGCLLSGMTAADMLTIVSSHEIREATTDPGDNGLNAWYDANGYEADDKCAWHNLYQMANGHFWVQPEYSNGGTVTASGFTASYPGPGCIVP